MLLIPMKSYTQPCAGVSGGVSRIWVADPADFNWTQTVSPGPYTAVALRTGATVTTGGGFFPIQFTYEEGQYKAAHTSKGLANKWAHSLTCQLPSLNENITEFLITMQAGAGCSGLLLVIEFNNGSIAVMGEMYVGGATIPLFKVKMDGTEIDSGKVFDDMAGATVTFKGDYSRPLYFYTGGAAAIILLQNVS